MTKQKPISKTVVTTSYILQALIGAAFLVSASMNISKTDQAVNMATDMGYSSNSVAYLGLILLISVMLYIIPKTNILGAILISCWLGGAVATHMIHGDPLGQSVFPAIFGIIVWLPLWLRMPNLKALIPVVK